MVVGRNRRLIVVCAWAWLFADINGVSVTGMSYLRIKG